MSIMDHLIDPATGEIDSLVLMQAADFFAQREWGGYPFPPDHFRRALLTVQDRAQDLRREWRRAHGLADDTPTTPTELPAWGASGDSYRRH